jgi:hypothetical protein
MALLEPTTINFDATKKQLPADGVTFVADKDGTFHFPKLKQGSTIIFDLEFEDSDGNPVVLTDLTNVSYEADWRAKFSDTAPELTATFSNPTSTTLRVRVEATATATLSSKEDDPKVWDLEIKYDDGGTEVHVDRVVSGVYEWTQEASK